MEKKSLSKPMKEILSRMGEFEYIKTIIFPEDVIVNVSNSILLSKLSGQIVRKNCPSVNKIFFQVTEVEKGHQGKVFEAEAEGQGLEMFPRCPFSTKVTWKKFLFTRGLFFQTNLLGQL